ncbi:ECF transporter S component [Periweissella ghanensis]|uniref:Pantothenate transporter PanT n=1 Tax=Periweissella ghanensis TaxID=467997 RepID=A0ABN8BMT8_9LACO|nr:ECF transporter S component [Periweissella ghanensis]MCM0600529.1 ECF transporter S component [Periweissella ghanensis]CAH0418261.1 Pantothenate transporter PanT [Periweissella ghanensis]
MRNIRQLVLTAIFMAIILLQVLVPFLGYIPLGAVVVGASVTIIQFTVALGTIFLGLRSGLILGLFWGLIRIWQAFTTPFSVGSLIFMNPFTAIGASVLIAVAVSLVIKPTTNATNVKVWQLGLAGALAALVNTGIVTLFTWIGFTFFHVDWHQFINLGQSQHFLGWFLSIIVGFNGIFEVIAGIIIVPVIAMPLLKVKQRLYK